MSAVSGAFGGGGSLTERGRGQFGTPAFPSPPHPPPPHTLDSLCSYGKIVSTKAILDKTTNKCKGGEVGLGFGGPSECI